MCVGFAEVCDSDRGGCEHLRNRPACGGGVDSQRCLVELNVDNAGNGLDGLDLQRVFTVNRGVGNGRRADRDGSRFLVVAYFQGIPVGELGALRRDLRDDFECDVVVVVAGVGGDERVVGARVRFLRGIVGGNGDRVGVERLVHANDVDGRREKGVADRRGGDIEGAVRLVRADVNRAVRVDLRVLARVGGEGVVDRGGGAFDVRSYLLGGAPPDAVERTLVKASPARLGNFVKGRAHERVNKVGRVARI